MAKFVDADAFLGKLSKLAELMQQGKIGEIDINLLIASTPRLEVVRCKDCKHYVDGPYDNGDMMCDCWGEWIFPNEDDFCSCGERKDNG